MQYFFDETHFSPAWFKEKADNTISALGSRYSPEFHVDLPIRKAFFGLSRSQEIFQEQLEWKDIIAKLRFQVKRWDVPLIEENFLSQIETKCKDFLDLISENTDTKQYPLEKLKTLLSELQEVLSVGITYYREKTISDQKETKDNKNRYILNDFYKFYDAIHEIMESLCSLRWELVNSSSALLYGDAGTGKSHLLADITTDFLDKEKPVVLLMGSQFSSIEPRTQILQLLGLNNTSFEVFLGVLDAAGQHAGIRALLMIDAINERYGIDLWKEHLASVIAEVSRFSHIALVVSCRSTYLDFIISDNPFLITALAKIEHFGFTSQEGSNVTHTYLNHRGIVRPSAPNLSPEFNNPLFLKTCCDSLIKQGLNEFPRGIQGVNQILGFYLKAIEDQINVRLKLDRRQNIVNRALNNFIQKLISQKSSYLPIEEAFDCFEEVFPSQGLESKSLVSQFEHEGLLTVEPVYIQSNKTPQDQVRFTFERFSDFQIAATLFDEYLKTTSSEAYPHNEEIFSFLYTDSLYKCAGIFEAFCVIFPERLGVEFPLIMQSKDHNKWTVANAFFNSLVLRHPSAFSEDTWKIVDVLGSFVDKDRLDVLLAITTEPENAWNANFLHSKLSSLSMPRRDSQWSIPIAQLEMAENTSLNMLLNWSLNAGLDNVDEERAKLTCLTLAWFLTTSNRRLRDRSTKSLASFLRGRFDLADFLLDAFEKIDDLYLLERLLASIYGAITYITDVEIINIIARKVYQLYFAQNEPPYHILLRDYARSIIEYACYMGVVFNDKELSNVRPPYKSGWPIEYVGKKDLEIYKENKNGYQVIDDITHSASSEWLGDFAKYVIRPTVNNWYTTLLTDRKRKSIKLSDVFLKWIAKFKKKYDKATCEKFDALYNFCVQCFLEKKNEKIKENEEVEKLGDISFVAPNEDYWKKRNENIEKFSELEQALLGFLDEGDRYIYQTQIRFYLNNIMHFNPLSNDQGATFDDELAQRWVTKRAHDLGWSRELHGKFDDQIGTGRSRNGKYVERIGKKYQWLALYELLARMADNLLFCIKYTDSPPKYNRLWNLSYMKNIDPSLLITTTKDDGWQKHPNVWWSPVFPHLEKITRERQRDWLDNDQEQLNSPTLIDVIEPKTKQKWLVLSGFRHHSTSSDIGSHVDTWSRIWCFAVSKTHLEKFIKALSGHILIDPDALPKIFLSAFDFIGEYPWHPIFNDIKAWEFLSKRMDIEFNSKVMPLIMSYESEGGGYDQSIDANVRIYMPSPWLYQNLQLHLGDAFGLNYIDVNNGKIIFKDPSVNEASPSTALIDKEALLEVLNKNNLAPVWIIAGEKGAYGGEGHDDYVGRRNHTFIYALDDKDNVVCKSEKIVQELWE